MAMMLSSENELTLGDASYWTPLPNALLIKLIWTRSSAAQSGVLYVLRHTYGYHETTPKAITLEEFQHGRKRRDGTRLDAGTGLSRSAVIDGLKRAVEAGLLTEEIDAHDRARIVKRYAIAPAVGSSLATPGEQPMKPEGTLPTQQRLILIKGRLQEVPETTSKDELDVCEESPLATSMNELITEAQITQRSPTTPSGIAKDSHSGSQQLPLQLPITTSIRERNSQQETWERNSQQDPFQASLARPAGARVQRRGARALESRILPDTQQAHRSQARKYPLVIERADGQGPSAEETSGEVDAVSDQTEEQEPTDSGCSEPVLQVASEQLSIWWEDVSEQQRVVARVQSEFERATAELERCPIGGHNWGELRRQQRFLQHHLEAAQQKLAQFELFVRLIEQGYSKDEACEQVYTQKLSLAEQEAVPGVDSASVSPVEPTLLVVSAKGQMPAPELSPKAWRAALFIQLLTLFDWDPQHLNKNSRGLANKAAMLLQESGIRPEQLPRLKQLFEQAYPTMTRYTPIALANHATELAAAL